MNKKLLAILSISGSLLFSAHYFDLIEYKDNILKIKFYKGAELSETPLETKNKNTNTNNIDNIDTNTNTNTNTNTQNNEKYITINFDHYELEFNCERGGYNHFSYTTVPDTGELSRYPTFKGYKDIIQSCNYQGDFAKASQNTNTYKSPKGKSTYDRGHGVHQNIWDHNKEYMKETNYMINIVPHESKQNRQGLWRYTEKLTECLRGDKNNKGDVLYVIGGNIWGNDTSNDYFVKSHNIQTPDELFKIIINEKENVAYSWIIPNNSIANPRNANDYVVSIADIEHSLGYQFANIPNQLRYTKQSTPRLPKGCSLK
jgi:endonuclease G